MVHKKIERALKERVKELTCLYGIARVVEQTDLTLEEILREIVALIPPAWQYPEITRCKIILDGNSYTSPDFRESVYKQTADIIVNDQLRGSVKVVYTGKKPEMDEGPFLQEERSLINAITKDVAFYIERQQAEEEKLKLQEQLRHADRLATIGQLSAGIAHELNEPLGNILGFAQLIEKCQELPEQTGKDIKKIIAASLHAREIIKKLMIFSRQMSPNKSRININNVVNEGLYILEARCAKEGIELIRELADDVPEIIADQSQLIQVLVNLVVNAIQAISNEGKVIIKTFASEGHVVLAVEDSGIGMTDDVKNQIFIPFFTTKDIDQGTGLGLSVVHGIVTLHQGSIEVKSVKPQGSIFLIKLPVVKSKPDDATKVQ